MRVLIDAGASGPRGEPTDDDLATLYDVPSRPWLRANMVSTLDGAATGANGVTGSINNVPDKRVFDLLRGLSDAIVVGAGTARAEGYGPSVRPLVLVSRRGFLPPALAGPPAGSVLMATCARAAGLESTRAALGDENVLVLGEDTVDLTALRRELNAREMTSLLCEGGPQLLNDLVAAGLLDELCFTQVPALVGGDQTRITFGVPVAAAMELRLLLEEDGTLLGRWFTLR